MSTIFHAPLNFVYLHSSSIVSYASGFTENATCTELVADQSKDKNLSSQFCSFQLRVIRQNELSESWIRRLMYEDRDDCGNATYVEYLCHVHKEVRALLK